MDNFGALLSSNDRQIYLERSGMVTRCRLACEALDKGRSVALVARTREEFNAARSLATLFSPEISLADRTNFKGQDHAGGMLKINIMQKGNKP